VIGLSAVFLFRTEMVKSYSKKMMTKRKSAKILVSSKIKKI
jgi:hypothetical protein